jgi:hypothetical protein
VGFVGLLLGDVGVAKYARHKLYKHSLVPVVWVGLQKLLIALELCLEPAQRIKSVD